MATVRRLAPEWKVTDLAARKITPTPLILWGAAFAFAALGALLLAFPQTGRPVIDARDQPFLVAVDSPQTRGSLWVTVRTGSPIQLNEDSSIELTIEVASDTDANPTLILGGLAATSLQACEGVGSFLDASSAPTSVTSLTASAQSMLTRYAQKQPSTDSLFSQVGEEARSSDAALAILEPLDFRTNTMQLVDAGSRSWVYEDEPQKIYDVKEATLTCTFDSSSMLDWSGPIVSFSAPDVMARVTDLASAGPITIDYDFAVDNPDGYSRVASTFVNSREYIDDATNQRLAAFSGTWWHRNTTGEQGVAISGGSVMFEPGDSGTQRVWWRLVAAFLASFGIALLVIIARRLANHVRRLN